MSDLISRSELIKALDKYCGSQRYLVSENIREIINNQPTAYDADRVVEELQSEAERWEDSGKEYFKLENILWSVTRTWLCVGERYDNYV